MKRELRDTLYTLPALLSLAHVFPQFATTFATLTEEQEQLVNDLFNRITFQPTERKDAFKFTTHGERGNYSPLQSLLDCILAAQPQSHQAHCPIRIIIYDKQMADSVENEAPIKPDLLGCKPSILGEVTGKDPLRIKWSEVELVLEVKDSWPEMLAQTAVYARAMLNEGSRWFAPALMFNHRSKSIRFGFPSRVGLYTTTELFLTQQADLEILVRALWSFQSSRASDVGIDPFAPIFNSKLHFFLPCGTNGSCSWWSVEAVITRRACVRGRAPHTFQVVRVLTSEEVLANQIANLGISRYVVA
ncbi:hypothetical protein OF83DRAFT_897456 [Amylostereum chailletii]|nr:hypothetical protein OF83DRAFT_897456 [Amylostereum chailletii]